MYEIRYETTLLRWVKIDDSEKASLTDFYFDDKIGC